MESPFKRRPSPSSLKEFGGMNDYLPPSLGELEEMEKFNEKPCSDAYTAVYKNGLRAGMSQVLAHLEAVIVIGGGEKKMTPEFMEHVWRHREAYRKRISLS